MYKIETDHLFQILRKAIISCSRSFSYFWENDSHFCIQILINRRPVWKKKDLYPTYKENSLLLFMLA